MNSLKIEKGAILALKDMIYLHNNMDDLINNNDKDPSWDGFIYLYTNEDLKVENIKYRIPVQVKGKNNEELLEKGLTKGKVYYPVEYKHLKKYFEDGGIVYFVIVISDYGEKKAIFYNALTTIKLKRILKELVNKRKVLKEDSTKNITLQLIKDKNELFQVLDRFGYNKEQQGSGNGEIIKRAITIKDIDKLKNIRLRIYSNESLFDINNKISTGEICLYGEISDLNIWLPFELKEQKNFNLKRNISQNIGCSKKIYYTKTIVEALNKNEITVNLSENLKLIINNEKDSKDYLKIDLNFNTAGSIKSICYDLEFIERLSEEKQLYINNKLACELKDIDISIDEMEVFKTFNKALSSFNINYNKKVLDFKEEDWKFINTLADIYLGNINDFKEEYKVYNLPIGEKIIQFLFFNKEKGNIIVDNTTLPKNIEFTIDDEEHNEHKIPFFIYYKREDWNKLYDFEEELLLNEIEKNDFDNFTQDMFYNLFIELLASYDINKNEKYYNMANLICNKLLEVNPNNKYGIINKFQLLKRKGDLTEEQLKELDNMLNNNSDKMLICAINILLENKYQAKKVFKDLTEEEKNVFENFPIYNLL